MTTTKIDLALATDGFTARWQLARSEVSQDTWIGTVVVELVPEVGGEVFRSVEVGILASDLVLLRDYLATHLAALEKGTAIVEYPFVGYDLGFQLQALFGELDEGDGELGIRILVNIGTSSKGSRLYAGAQSVVAASTVRAFIDAISALGLK